MNHAIKPEHVEQDKLYREMGLSDDEYNRIKAIINRHPNYTETGIFSVMWSEHCSYKTSKPLLGKFPTKGPHVLMGPGEGAGVVDIGDDQAVVFKIESHNSPSTVDPYEGAATGVGGILRDVFSMGARPIAVMNSLRFGQLGDARTNYLFKEIVRGIAGYGNEVGVPTVGGEIQFDNSYQHNPLVNAMAVGLINHDDIQRGIAAGVGNTVIYAGAPTGRDGIHGATHSSDDETPPEASPASGHPKLEKRLIAACLEVIHSDALIGMQDMGAAGLTSSGSEMASKAGTGMLLNLDQIPQAEENMNAYEMMLSETQERMLLVVEKGREDEVIQLFQKHDVEAVAAGEVIADKVFRIEQQDTIQAEVPVDALDKDAPVYHMPAEEPAYFKAFQNRTPYKPEISDHQDVLKQLLQRPTIASKQSVYEQFDSNSQGQTISEAGAGAAIVKIADHDKAIAITTDCNARYIYLDPEKGGQIAVAEAARNIVCSGARPLAITDGLNFGNPTNPEIFWQMEKSIAGISAACTVLNTPVISGNVSMYNQSKETAIFPTPIIGMVGLIDSLEYVTPNTIQAAGDGVYLVGETEAEFGGSELQGLLKGAYEGKAPQLDLNVEKARQEQLLKAIREGVIQSAEDLSEGGLAVGLAQSMFNEKDLGIHAHVSGHPTPVLFSETQSRFIVTVKPENQTKLETMLPDAKQIGVVTDDHRLTIEMNDHVFIEEDGTALNTIWKEAIPNLLKSNT